MLCRWILRLLGRLAHSLLVGVEAVVDVVEDVVERDLACGAWERDVVGGLAIVQG